MEKKRAQIKLKKTSRSTLKHLSPKAKGEIGKKNDETPALGGGERGNQLEMGGENYHQERRTRQKPPKHGRKRDC